jgi:NTE family protein
MTKFGLALGGGGARGLAHVGVLKILDEEKINIHSISGCSMGAIVGGLYAYYGNAKDVEDFIHDAIKHPKFIELGNDKLKTNNQLGKSYFEQFFDYIGKRVQALKSLSTLSYFDEDWTNEIYEIIPDVPIENFKIKFSAIATDLLSGEEINFTSGSLRKIIKASSAIPGIFPPVRMDKYFLVDGSTSESVPAAKVREIGANRVLGVDVTRSIKIINEPQNVFEMLYRAEDITSYHLSLLRLKEADLVIHPDVKHLTWADFDQTDEIILAGEKIAKDNLVEIKKLIKQNAFLLEIKQFLKKLKG